MTKYLNPNDMRFTPSIDTDTRLVYKYKNEDKRELSYNEWMNYIAQYLIDKEGL